MYDLLGFQFYGSGNIGDDLMLDGFLAEFSSGSNGLKCVLPQRRQLETSRLRFPAVQWTRSYDAQYGAWLGVGDTPIQGSGGSWLLEQLEAAMSRENYKYAAMVGVGAEREAIGLAARYRTLLKKFELIGTRDEESADLLLREFGCSKNQVVIGGDLAHLCPSLHSARESLQPLPDRPYAVASLICGGDGLPQSSLDEVRTWLSKSDSGRTVCLATEVRPLPHAEVDLHKRWTTNRFWSSRKALKLPMLKPDYWKADSTGALIKPFEGVQCLVSSRYHGLVIGAWLGCRIAAVARGSKIESLARELDIPFVGRQFKAKDLDRLYEEARPVDALRLHALADRARTAMSRIGAFSRQVTNPAANL